MYDDYTVEYHLTPDGWVKGRGAYLGKFEGAVNRPNDCVLTMHQNTYQASGYSKEQVTWGEVWRANDATENIVQLLRLKFPLPS